MNKIKHEQGIETDRDLFPRGDMQELAFYLADLHMDVFRREKLLDDFKKFFWLRYPLQAPVLVKEIDRAVREYDHEANEF